jgi:pyruvate formate lyase activating enzyme
MIDPEKHKLYTGVDNRLILENLKALAERRATIQIRLPLIGGVNDDDASINAAAAFIAALPGARKPVSLLPFHDVASGKDLKLGQTRTSDGFGVPGSQALESVIRIFFNYGLSATVGG